MPVPVSSTDSDSLLAKLLADRAAKQDLSETQADVAFVSSAFRPVNARDIPLVAEAVTDSPTDEGNAATLSDAELDQLAFAEAMEHVFRGRPSAIIGPFSAWEDSCSNFDVE